MISYTKKRRRWVALLLTVLLLCSFWSPVSAQALDTAMDSDMLYTETAETISDEAADVDLATASGDEVFSQPLDEVEQPATVSDTVPTAETEVTEESTEYSVSGVEAELDSNAEVLYETYDGQWIAGSLTEAFAVVDGGSIKLLRDITINNSSNTALRLSKEATLLGENHSICLERGSIIMESPSLLHLGKEGYNKTLTIYSRDDTNCIFDMRESSILEMYDGVTIGPSRAGGQPAGVFLQGWSTFNMYGGCITDCENWATVTGGVLITDNARFNLLGGTIQSCSGYMGGAVGILANRDSSEKPYFRMSGGEIKNCRHVGSSYGGGAVFAYTAKPVDIEITGGKISGCSAPGLWGGGLYLYVNNNQADIRISGVEISGCSAKYGGGVFLGGGNTILGEGTVLHNNTADSEGGGLWAIHQTGIHFGAVTVTGNMAASGGGVVLSGGSSDMSKAVIHNNTASVAGDDLMLRKGSTGVSGAVLPGGMSDLTLIACNHAIDGWYADGPDSRWTCPDTEDWSGGEPLAGTISTAESVTHLYLKAAHGKVEPKPMEPLTITPADIIVYSGGRGYVGVVAGDGEPISRENGIPEPGYYITLPESLNTLLGSELPNNLSGSLTFHYDDYNGTTRQWSLALYGTEEHSTGRHNSSWTTRALQDRKKS